jgi:hypothetical protein
MESISIKDSFGTDRKLAATKNNDDLYSIMNTNLPFELSVNMGLVPNFSPLDKFGVNHNVEDDATPADIWEAGGEYVYDPVDTAPIAYVSSNDILDVGQTIEITGLDINGDEVVQSVVTTGQVVVALGTPLWRVYRMQNVSDEGLNITGMLYCHTEATPTEGVPSAANVRALIDNGHNQTLMAIYTIPKGKVGFLYRGEVGVQVSGNVGSLAEHAHMHYLSRRFGKIFTIKKSITCMVGGGSAVYQDERSFPDVIPGLTDIKLTAHEVSTDMGVFGTFDIMLVDEGFFSESYLTAIGQPGH